MSKEKTGVITEIKKFATHDGPGIRTTVFTKGCPLKCTWCANPETQNPWTELYFISKRCKDYGECIKNCLSNALSLNDDNKINREKCTLCMKCTEVCPHGALKEVGTIVTVEEVVREIEKDMPFYGQDGGVTISGGEPLYQPEFTMELLKRCREIGISTAIDTSGFAQYSSFEEILEYTDLILLDIKHMDSKMHKIGTGVSNEIILENAKKMAKKTNVRISIPLISGFNNSHENLVKTAEFIRSIGIEWIDINPLHILGAGKYKYLGLQQPYEQYKLITNEEIAEGIRIMEDRNLKATVGRMM